MAKVNLDITLNPFSKKLQFIHDDAFKYHTIDINHVVRVHDKTEYFLTEGITIVGDLEIKGSGRLVLRD